MYDPTVRRELRIHTQEVCDAARAQRRAVDRTIDQFRQCSRDSRKTIENSYRILDRLNQRRDERRRG